MSWLRTSIALVCLVAIPGMLARMIGYTAQFDFGDPTRNILMSILSEYEVAIVVALALFAYVRLGVLEAHIPRLKPVHSGLSIGLLVFGFAVIAGAIIQTVTLLKIFREYYGIAGGTTTLHRLSYLIGGSVSGVCRTLLLGMILMFAARQLSRNNDESVATEF